MARFIVEIGSNHNSDVNRTLRLLDACADAGAAAAKLQVFRVEELFSTEALAAKPELVDRKEWEFPLEMLPPIRERCDTLGIELGATPFSRWAVDELEPHLDFFKVASYELLWHDLIRDCAATGRPLVISSGMATLDEVGAAVEAARDAGCSDLTVLHCVSGYPTRPEHCNLAAIETIRAAFGVPAGWSDHSGVAGVVARSVRRWGATDVELHVDLDGSGNEAGEHCWSPEDLRAAIALSETGSGGEDHPEADGDGVKRPMADELHDVTWRADPSDGLRPLQATRARLAPA